MATPFENFVNTELPKRIGTNESPITPGAGDIPVFTGVGLLTESKTASEAGLATETFATNAANTAETNAKSYADDLIISIYKFQTTYNPQTTGNFPTTANTVGGVAIKKGFTWVVSGVTGQYTFQGVTVNNGDTLLALVDNASATSAADWHITESNLGYTPENQNNKDTDGTLAANSDTKYPSQKAVKTYADTKQAALADVITADTYGSSTQYPVITFNAKGIATGVTLQTLTFTDATFSVQKNDSPSIAATWSLSALTESRVHTYPDKAINFGDLSFIASTNGNTLSGTRTNIIGSTNCTVSGTDNTVINAGGGATLSGSNCATLNASPITLTGNNTTAINCSAILNSAVSYATIIGGWGFFGHALTANAVLLGTSRQLNLFAMASSGIFVKNSHFAELPSSIPVSGTIYATVDGSQTRTLSNCLDATAGQYACATHEVQFIVSVGADNTFGGVLVSGVFTAKRKISVFRAPTSGTYYVGAVQTIGTDETLGTISGTYTPVLNVITAAGATQGMLEIGCTRAGGVAGQEGIAISAVILSHYSK